MRIEGLEAIERAEALGRKLCKEAGADGPARVGLDPAEARSIAATSPSLIYLEVEEDEEAGGGDEPRAGTAIIGVPDFDDDD